MSLRKSLTDKTWDMPAGNATRMKHVRHRMGRLMRRGLGALGCTCLATALAGQESQPLFRTTSELVLLDVQVIHKKTATSTAALRRDDLQVFEDGKPQTITFFSRDE